MEYDAWMMIVMAVQEAEERFYGLSKCHRPFEPIDF
jgi:hypothetical protein